MDEHKDRMVSLMEAINSLSDDVKFTLELEEDTCDTGDYYILRAKNDDGGYMEIHEGDGVMIIFGDTITPKCCSEEELIEHAQFWLAYGKHPEATE